MSSPALAGNTQSTGSGAAFTNYQSSLALFDNLAPQGIFAVRSSSGLVDGADRFTIGMVRHFAGSFNPGGWNADGSVKFINQNTSLFSVLGTNFGGDGKNTFALPDLRGATIVGAPSLNGQMATTGYQVAQTFGSATTTLTLDQLPAHAHSLPGGKTTGVAGSGQAFDQREPSVTLTYLIAANGVFPGGGSAVSIGQVAAFAGDYVPQGWRPADGEVLNIADFSTLYSIIGNTYGGDGVNTFALPDLRGRTIVGTGVGPGGQTVTLGETFGSDTTVLTLSQLAAHAHDLTGGGATGVTGGADPVSNVQPSIGLTYLVATTGIFPSFDTGVDGAAPYLGEVIPFAGAFTPNGYHLADGSLLSIAQNSGLFSLFGTTYGGDGVNTFALPDLRGRDIIDAGGDYAIGQKVGTDSTVLTEANLPAHTHTVTAVPEPATWSTMLLGLGLLGAALRRRAAVSRTPLADVGAASI